MRGEVVLSSAFSQAQIKVGVAKSCSILLSQLDSATVTAASHSILAQSPLPTMFVQQFMHNNLADQHPQVLNFMQGWFNELLSLSEVTAEPLVLTSTHRYNRNC